MASLEENLQVLEQTKADFKTALESKGVDLTDVPFTQYPEKLNDVGGSENLDTELTEQEELLTDLEADVNALEDKPKSDVQYMIDQTNSCRTLFYGYKGTDLPFIKNIDTSNVTDMRYMFQSCSKLTSLDVSNFNTNNVTDMYGMFATCSGLTSLDLSNFNTEKVKTIGNMFTECKGLRSLDLSSFNTSNVTNMDGTFYQCYIKELDLSSFDTSNVTSMYQTFYLNSALEKIHGKLNVIKVNAFSSTFQSCTKLTDVILLNIKKSLSMSWCTLLSNDSLINTIQQLWDLTGQTSQTLTLSDTSKENIANIYVKLITPTAEQIEADPYINNKKPCEVCESTDEGAMLITEYLISKNWALA